MKTCYKCGLIKPAEAFWKCERNKDGLQSHCIDCDNERDKQKTVDQRIKYNATMRTSRYGITVEDFEFLVLSQGNRCAICRTLEPGGAYNSWNLDHDHSCCPNLRKARKGDWGCGQCVRGALCWYCNVAVGFVEKGWGLAVPEILAYLNRYT